MKDQSLPVKIPEYLYGFFWDVSAKDINPTTNAQYVVQRLLDKGNVEAIRWVLKEFPRSVIIDTLRTRSDFSPWNGVFWSKYLGIPREEVRCLEPSYLTMRKQHWRY